MNIVVKISSNLINPDNPVDILEVVSREIAQLKKEGHNVVVVTSGAVMYGMKALSLNKRPETVPLLQSCASIGQIDLMYRFKETFSRHGMIPGEILLSADDFTIRSRYLNLRNTIETLLLQKVVPVINENDTINTEELKLGDNDHLSSLISIMLDFDRLILLTDVDGVYSGDPKKDPNAKMITHIDSIDDNIIAYASESTSLFTTGGMKKKLISAGKASKSGVSVFIGNGYNVSLMKVVQDIEVGTYIKPGPKICARKKWIAFSPSETVRVVIDDGAYNALIKKKASLLASGIVEVHGIFVRGALISIYSDNKKIAQGLTNYSSGEIELIKGKKSGEIKKILSDFYEEVIHKNNLILTENNNQFQC